VCVCVYVLVCGIYTHTHIGTFFVDDTQKTGKELNMGELPLGFAACTNQMGTFKILCQVVVSW
jgi:hypothetical protein